MNVPAGMSIEQLVESIAVLRQDVALIEAGPRAYQMLAGRSAQPRLAGVEIAIRDDYPARRIVLLDGNGANVIAIEWNELDGASC